MTFHSYELTEKYITLLSKYKEIEKYFEEDENCKFLVIIIGFFNVSYLLDVTGINYVRLPKKNTC